MTQSRLFCVLNIFVVAAYCSAFYVVQALNIPQFEFPNTDLAAFILAPYAQIIWFVIFALLWIVAILDLTTMFYRQQWRAVRPMWSLALALGAVTPYLWRVEPFSATVLNFASLWFLLRALVVANQNARFLQATLAITAAWTIFSALHSVAMIGSGYDVILGGTAWGLLAIICITSLTVVILVRLPTVPEFGLTMIWGYIAMAYQNWHIATPIAFAAVISCLVVAVAIVLGLRMRPKL